MSFLTNGIHRLAYCGTPMILSAIDVKLSSSYSEMLERRRALEHCSEVVGRSRRIYDVTDFFSQGTNHILQLAYAITKNLFLENNVQQNGTSRIEHPSRLDAYCGDGKGQGTNLVPAFKGLRIRGWIEAFLKYPRAYLLISTCIDYSLATGRLPRDEFLPPLVRGTVSVILGLPKLPWTIGTHKNVKDARAEKYIEEQRKPQDRGDSASSLLETRNSCLDDTWYLTLLHNIAEGFNGFEGGSLRNSQNYTNMEPLSEENENAYYADPNPNLNFFNFDTIAGKRYRITLRA